MKKHYDYLILILSLYVVVILALSVIQDWPEDTQEFIDNVDFAICLVFLADWFYFFSKSESKLKYFKSRFIDLIASIPYVVFLRAFRIARVVRIVRTLRLLRGVKGMIPLVRLVTRNKRQSILVIYILSTALIYFYCSLGIYNFEKGINANLKNYPDALWMCFTTLTSVGYGDIYPITGGGRIMAAVLVITGLGLFSLVTAEIATILVKYLRAETDNPE